jgi:hypothetical protein
MSAPAAIEAIVMSAVTSETKASGKVRKVTFLLPNDDPDHPFAGMVGERLHIVCVKVNDDETTEPASKPAEPKERKAWADLPPAQQAAIRCEDHAFRLFIAKYCDDQAIQSSQQVAAAIRNLCGIGSRADLNTNHRARVIWHGLDRQFLEVIGRLAHG